MRAVGPPGDGQDAPPVPLQLSIARGRGSRSPSRPVRKSSKSRSLPLPIYALDDVAPSLGEGAWVAPSADLIGDVRLGASASVWFGAVVRADNTPIIIGAESNIQDGAVCHSDPGAPLTIGDGVTV